MGSVWHLEPGFLMFMDWDMLKRMYIIWWNAVFFGLFCIWFCVFFNHLLLFLNRGNRISTCLICFAVRHHRTLWLSVFWSWQIIYYLNRFTNNVSFNFWSSILSLATRNVSYYKYSLYIMKIYISNLQICWKIIVYITYWLVLCI